MQLWRKSKLEFKYEQIVNEVSEKRKREFNFEKQFTRRFFSLYPLLTFETSSCFFIL
jgi:hypothetical protein